MYKVFVFNKAVIFTDSLNGQEPLENGSTVHPSDMKAFWKAYQEFQEKENANVLYVVDPEPEKLWEGFREEFVHVDAAGGLVVNEKDEYLFIFRNHKWDLPKGKVEPGEDMKEAAVREVEEETGISPKKEPTFLMNTFHTYKRDGEHHLKRTCWFMMEAAASSTGQPQEEEGITHVEWLPVERLDKVRRNTYASILEVVAKGVGSGQSRNKSDHLL